MSTPIRPSFAEQWPERAALAARADEGEPDPSDADNMEALVRRIQAYGLDADSVEHFARQPTPDPPRVGRALVAFLVTLALIFAVLASVVYSAWQLVQAVV